MAPKKGKASPSKKPATPIKKAPPPEPKKPAPKKCGKCKKVIEIKKKEVNESGFVYHSYCFVCSNCRVQLDEKSVNFRKKKLYCPKCVIFISKTEPPCKVYYNTYVACYRVIL